MNEERDASSRRPKPGMGVTRRTVVAGAAWAVPALALAAPAYAFSTSGPVQATGCAGKLPGGSCVLQGYYKQGYRFYFRLYNPPLKTACIEITSVTVNGTAPDGAGKNYKVQLPSNCAFLSPGCCGADPTKSLTVLPNHTVIFAVETDQASSANGVMRVVYTVRDVKNGCTGPVETFEVTSDVSGLPPPTGGQCAPFPIPSHYGCTLGNNYCQ